MASNLKDYKIKCEQLEKILQQGAQPLAEQRKGIEAFGKSEATYRALFESATDSILLIEDGRFIHCNQSASQMFGCSRKQIIGKSPADVSPPLQPDGRDSEEKSLQLIEKLEEGIPLLFEWRHQRFDGSQFDVEVNLAVLNTPDKKCHIAILRDISDRKEMESLLERERDQAEMYLDVAEVILLALDEEGCIKHINRKGRHLLGYKERELKGRNFFEECLPADIRSKVKETFQKIMAGETDAHRYHENRVLTASGDQKLIAWHNTVVQSKTGQSIGTLSSGEDITERRKAEALLQQSEERYRLLVENIPSVSWKSDDKGHTSYISPNVSRVYGYTNEEIYTEGKKLWFDRIHPDDVQRVEEEYANLFKSGSTFDVEYRIRHREGHWIWLHDRADLVETEGNKRFALGVFTDVTDRAQIRQALRESEAHYRTLFESASDAILLVEQDRILECNQKCLDMFDCTKQQILNKSVLDFSPPTQPDGHDSIEKVQRILAAGEKGAAQFFEWHHQRFDGSQFDAEVNLAPLEKKDQVRFIAIVRDISDRKRAEIELKESKDYLNQVINCIGDPIFVKDEEHKYVLVNDALCAASGLDREELIGKTNYQYKSKVQAESILGQERSIFKDEHESVVEEENIDKNGRKVTVMTKRTLLTDKFGNKQIVGAIRDVTQQKELEAQFMQAQKMEAIGVLAGGVAHDFNNLLTVINGYSNMLLEEFDQGDPRREDLEEIKKAGHRAASLTSQLLAFSRQQIIDPKALNVNDVIEDTNKILRRLIGEDIELALNLQPDLGMVKADLGQIQQIIMNLAVNAREAMPRGGRLAIETAKADLNEEFVKKYPYVKTGSYIMISVSDNGIGMDKATVDRIFEPFFTTKELKKGTGLGLSTVYGIVKQSNGYIWAYSEPGMGTTFKVYLPCATGKVKTPTDYDDEEHGNGGNETILMVEDESSVQALATRILGKKGYNVLKASNPKDALRIGQDFSGKIDLILTDVVMPEMNVIDLIDKIKTQRPDIKVLFMSGYTDDTIVNHGILKPDIEFISKPFTAKSLAKKVRQVLDSNSNN